MSDDIWKFGGINIATRVRRLEGSVPRTQGGDTRFSASSYRAIDSAALSNGKLNLATSSAVTVRGAIAPVSNNPNFGVVTDGTTATIYWDGTNGSKVIVQSLSDGTKATVPPGNILITGLTPSTAYNLIPYWSPYNQCTIGWVQGDTGTPQICFSTTPTNANLAMASLLGREQLCTTYLTIKTTAGAPSGGGSTGSGGDPTRPPTSCVMLGTDIEPLDDAEYFKTNMPCSEWWHLVVKGGKSLFCTPDHPVYDADGFRRRADSFSVGDKVTMRYGTDELVISEPHRRVCTKVQVTMPRVKLYWANDFLSHNYKGANTN